MIQKKVLGTGMKQRRITGRWCSSTLASTILSALLLAGLSSIKVISSCVISPSESVAIVGDRFSFSCNARPNNEQEGSISVIKLGSDGTSGTYIFRPPVYGPGSRIITKLFLAHGYFLSHLDDSHSKVTIETNETQLKHGGEYFCTCVESTPTLGIANFTVLDKLSFVRSGDKALTPGALVDLNCSVLFNGSTSSAFIHLIISDANGIEVSSKRNLSLTKNVTGHHVIHHKVIADQKEEQRFTCELKVWNKPSSEGRPLHSMSSQFSLNWDHLRVTTSADLDSLSIEYQTTGRAPLIAVGVIAFLLVVAAVIIAIFIYKTRHKRSITNGTEGAHAVEQRSSVAYENIRYKDAEVSIQHPPHKMPPQNLANSHYESLDKEKRIVGLNQTYEELNLNDHSNQTPLYIDVIP